MFKEFRFSFADVRPDDKVLADFLQVNDEKTFRDLSPILEGVLDRLKDNDGIVGGYSILDCEGIDMKDSTIRCNGKDMHVGKRISSYLKDASRIAVFVCTAGPIFTDLTNEYLKNGDLLESFITDAVGSATVENAMDRIHEALEREMYSDGLKISNRYSPGYCDWDVSGQHKLFSLIDDNETGVSLTKSSLMIPIKSVSGVIGIGKNVKKLPYGCMICHSPTCVYRNIRNNKKS